MVNFIIGFIIAWILFAIIIFVSNLLNGSVLLWDGFETYLILLPILPIIILIEYIKNKRK